jgi:radical S-adenosyl methionine domain-containing protein 2
MLKYSFLRFSSTRFPFTANLHFLRTCNFRCNYCYATFEDSIEDSPRGLLPHHDLMTIVKEVSKRFTKVTFAGGEPTLYSKLPEMLLTAKEEGAIVNIVTNGSLINSDWLKTYASAIDLLTLSADSDDPQTHIALGRREKSGKALTSDHYISLACTAWKYNIEVKLNSVVTNINKNENISQFVRLISPSRWKILQAMPIEGQNDKFINDLIPSSFDFEQFINRHKQDLIGSGIRIVPESIDTIRGSYIMVDPLGRFFDDTTGRYRYSRPILEVGIDSAWSDVSFDEKKFLERGGTADYYNNFRRKNK